MHNSLIKYGDEEFENEEVDFKDVEEICEVYPLAKQKPKEFNLALAQVIICISFIISVLLIKTFAVDLYDELSAKYVNYIEQVFMIEDGKVTIVDENEI